MPGHILKAGVRALAASLILGGILIFATGGFDSPNVRPLGGVIIAGFFIFWIVFVFMFGKRVPKHDPRRQDRDLDDSPHLSVRGQRRRDTRDDDEAGDGDGGGGDGD
jgi:hypothetical protein